MRPSNPSKPKSPHEPPPPVDVVVSVPSPGIAVGLAKGFGVAGIPVSSGFTVGVPIGLALGFIGLPLGAVLAAGGRVAAVCAETVSGTKANARVRPSAADASNACRVLMRTQFPAEQRTNRSAVAFFTFGGMRLS
jgi:hypothetical protein